MGRIYLIRHGEVAWNKENNYVGRTDLPLNETGRLQARYLADYFECKHISAIYSSDLSRARETAETIAGRLGLAVQLVTELQEVNYGEWEGISENEIRNRYPNVFHVWRANPVDVRIPSGETFGELRDRAYPALCEITRKHPDEDIVVVAHKSCNRALLCCVLGVDVNGYRQIGQGNACINIIESRNDGSLVVDTINEQCHLPVEELAQAAESST